MTFFCFSLARGGGGGTGHAPANPIISTGGLTVLAADELEKLYRGSYPAGSCPHLTQSC